MSKIIASKVYINYLPENQIAVSFITKDRYTANLFVNELKDCEIIEVSAKPHKEARSIKQNKFLWAIISKMSEKLNGEKTEESTMKIYGDLLVSANVKRDLIAILPIALETIKTTFRAIIPTGQYVETQNEKTGKKARLNTYWVYQGSSKFNVKEMNELLDIAIHQANEMGILDSEIESIREEFR